MIGRPSLSLSWDKSEAEADVVVAITGAVVVPVRRTAVLRVVVPTAATVHAVRAIGSSTAKKFLSESNRICPVNKGNQRQCVFGRLHLICNFYFIPETYFCFLRETQTS